MASQPILPVPLYVSARRSSGRTCHVLLSDSAGRDLDGPFYCQAAAPNGDEAEGHLDQLNYAAVLGLFARGDTLAVDHEGSDIPGDRKLKAVGLRLWSGGKPLELDKGEMELVQGAPGVAHIRLRPAGGARIDHVQLWSGPGAVTVTVWPKGGSLFPMPGLPDVQRKVRPVVLGGNLHCSAYWGFYRHSVLRAVRHLGAEMLAKVADPKAEPSDEEIIVATHHALNFMHPSRELLAPLAASLERQVGADAAILLWSIAFDGQIPVSPDDRHRLFERAILELNGNGCLYTEVFRMLVQRLGDGEEQWRDHLAATGRPPGDMENAIQWARQLAGATYWDAEHLTYRALDPRFPDATATDDQLGIGAKKKSALIALN